MSALHPAGKSTAKSAEPRSPGERRTESHPVRLPDKDQTAASTPYLLGAWAPTFLRMAGWALAGLVMAGCLPALPLAAQTFVTPKLGGGQVAADMVHIDIYYDAEANVLSATVDDSYGTPELRALEPGYAFNPQQPYAVLNGKAYNSQYGWNVGGFFTPPAGAAIWIELLDSAPNLETYSGWGQTGTYAPIFGMGGTPRLWKWSGVMVHNTYAVLEPTVGRFFADYHIYFGDAATGSRENLREFGDTTVRLEWTTVPVESPMAFRFGAVEASSGAPLLFINSGQWESDSLAVVNLRHTNAGPCALQYACCWPVVAVPATDANGGPAANHAAPGSCLELEFVSLSGPSEGNLGVWEPGQSLPAFRLAAGEAAGTNRLVLSQNCGAPGSDPYGCVQGRHLTLSQPGLYCLGFRVVDTSTNGTAGGPIHAPSLLYRVYLQAGLTVSSLTRDGQAMTVRFGGELGQRFFLERKSALGLSGPWQTVAGPLTGTNRLQTLTDPNAKDAQVLYRLRAENQ